MRVENAVKREELRTLREIYIYFPNPWVEHLRVWTTLTVKHTWKTRIWLTVVHTSSEMFPALPCSPTHFPLHTVDIRGLTLLSLGASWLYLIRQLLMEMATGQSVNKKNHPRFMHNTSEQTNQAGMRSRDLILTLALPLIHYDLGQVTVPLGACFPIC